MTSIVRAWPYQPGEAVYQTAYTSFIRPYTWTTGIVLSVADHHLDDGRIEVRKRVKIRRADGKQRTVCARSLLYRGYCAACQLPAHEVDGALFCPHCGGPAVNEPPGDRLAAHLYDAGELKCVQKTRESVLTGCTLGESYGPVETRFDAAYQRMAEACGLHFPYRRFAWPFNATETIVAFEHLAVMENVEAVQAMLDGIIQAEGERIKSVIRAIQRMPPIDGDEFGPRWTAPKDDSTPDGADDTTRWLEAQMKRRAA